MNAHLLDKQTVLVVDDIADNIAVVKNTLIEHYRVLAATNGAAALKIARHQPQPDIILLDIMMPDMDGYAVCQQLKADARTSHIPVVFVTALGEIKDETQGFELGAVDYITKPISPPLLVSRVKTHLALSNQNRELQIKVDEQTKELIDTQLAIVERLGRAAEYKDNETGNHVIRMSRYSYILAKAAGLSEQRARLVESAAPMHDIGKIGIPDHILKKPGRFNEAEMSVMRQHASFGALIIGEHHSELLKLAKVIALTHHEKWNGSGYPEGMKGDEISIEARIVSIADVFDALTSERPYKKSWPVADAVSYIEAQSGIDFDPALAGLVKENLDDMLAVRDQYSEH